MERLLKQRGTSGTRGTRGDRAWLLTSRWVRLLRLLLTFHPYCPSEPLDPLGHSPQAERLLSSLPLLLELWLTLLDMLNLGYEVAYKVLVGAIDKRHLDRLKVHLTAQTLRQTLCAA